MTKKAAPGKGPSIPDPAPGFCCPEFKTRGDCKGLCVSDPWQITLQAARAIAAEKYEPGTAIFEKEVAKLRYVPTFAERRARALHEMRIREHARLGRLGRLFSRLAFWR